jgi:hypothetical protein
MAELVLTRVGAAVGGAIVPGFGAALGAAAGRFIGGQIDNAVFGSGTRNREGPRLADLHLQASSEGASIPAVYGRVRLSGQMIWAAQFKEHVNVAGGTPAGAGGKGGGAGRASTTQTVYTYSLSFAVGLCEGEAARIAGAWANGAPLDLSQYAWRFHDGAEDQAADPLIEAIEGAANAPAYRGLSYVVFEDFPLEAFGNTPPQLSFEIVRPVPSSGAPRLEDLARGVCLIPGAGEFVLADDVIRRTLSPGAETAENMHGQAGRSNLALSLDQLGEDLPHVETVMLVVAWFGSDLRCGNCQIRPGVERADKTTRPRSWRAGGVDRAGAHVISTHDGGPAYGGTPADFSVVQAIAALRARGYRVGLYPFILMDVPPGNSLPDPYGGSAQAAYPWRGRITCTPAAGQSGSPDKAAPAAGQVAAFFGAATAGNFAVAGDEVTYSGPAEWSFRRFILHCAKLASAAGGVDAFVLGSELRGLSTVRSAASTYPAVAALRALASDVRGVLGPGAKLTYAADWSEYRGHQPQDGSGDVHFHLDPLWADAAIDCVGVDWYPPLADWRDGAAHADASIASGAHDPNYLSGRIEAGEDFDFYYADGVARDAQSRTAITDGAYGKPWVFRAKDVRSWWSNAHYDRPGGVENATPTAWAAQSKPIWFVELGCPAIDKGANAPNLFVDVKSAESAVPPFSSSRPDDLIQRRLIEAYLSYWSGAANPVSSVYGGPMIDASNIHLWAWDARPFPYFPARRDLWSDGLNWRLGHWLNGRAGAPSLAETVLDLCRRAGVNDAEAGGLSGVVGGYVVDSAASARAALEPLMAAYGFDAAETEGAIVFRHLEDGGVLALTLEGVAQEEDGRLAVTRADGAEAPVEARVLFIDPTRDHRIAMVSARRRDAAGVGVATVEAPLSLSLDDAEAIAAQVLAQAKAHAETIEIVLPPSRLAVTPGDRLVLDTPGLQGDFRVERIEEGPLRRASMARSVSVLPRSFALPAPRSPASAAVASAPDFALLDLPILPDHEDDYRPLAALYAAPWPGQMDIYVGATARARAETPAIMGELVWDLWRGPTGRWDEGNYFRARLAGGALESVDDAALFAGANTFAIEQPSGWEILQARDIALVAPDTYEFRRLLRGQLGTEQAMGAPAPAGSRIVKLDRRLVRVAVAAHETGAVLDWAAVASPLTPTDAAATHVSKKWSRASARPYSPVHLKGRRGAGGEVKLTWIRRTRQFGDDWQSLDVPLSEERETYLVEVMSGSAVIRSATVDSPQWTYASADQIADFGAPPASLTVRAAQISSTYGVGARAESTIWL